jgi:carbon monoxide dehydrogenase subunit G
MELEHSFTVPASVGETWAAFNDPEKLVPCFPGATLISVDGDRLTGSAKIKLGPIALQYNGVGTYLERDEGSYRVVIEAKGKDKRGNGTANATVTAQLRAEGEGTAVDVTTDLAVTGKPAQFGRGVMQDVSDKLLGQFLACLQTRLGAPEATQINEATDTTGADSAGVASSGAVSSAAPSATPQASADVGVVPRTEAPASRTPPAPAQAAEVELNLLRTVGHVLLTRYAARTLGPLAFLAGYWLGRRSRR